jgi:glycosyltransferase involved in cell wall biosynthesis
LNRAGSLQRCIDSVVRQTHPNKELIIVDGGSIDGTLDVIRRNAPHVAEWISAADGGIYQAFNTGVRLSHGEWMLFLGSDDVLWSPDMLERVAVQLEGKRTGEKVAYGRVAVLGDEEQLVEMRGEPWRWYQDNPVSRWTFEHQGVFHHRNLFETHGLFDDSFRLCGDHELLLRELKQAKAIFLEDIVVAGFSLGGSSSLPRNLRRMIDERKKALRLNDLPDRSAINRSVMIKMYGFEVIRALLGLRIAEKIDQMAKSWRSQSS